jgi:hypothetical protein
MAALVRLRARSSSTWPSRTRTVMTTAVSKYVSTMPCMRKPWGKRSGASVAVAE